MIRRARRTQGPEGDPLWYKDAVIYELHVRGFFDSDGDGIGDFRGLTAKLDYLQDLGVTALWLLPFYPSPLRDDGYDIASYSEVNPSYGTMQDFRRFMREATRRGLRVITELVINHTSDAHAWFQRARRAPAGSRWRNYYVWSDTPRRYDDARVIFNDFEPSNWSWDPIAKAYFWHRFYSHQPDLNFDSPAVRKAIADVMDSWLRTGVSGLRLDAIPYLYEREGTTCENLPETHDFIRDLRRHLDEKFRNRMLLAEANQWPEDAAAYFGRGDECNMVFHFPVMPRLFLALSMEDRFPVLDVLTRTPAIPETCQWALFLRNHDELTLEMVTDEERDYMTRMYAVDRRARINLGIRRRLAPLLNNDRKKIELINGLLFSLPGTPVIYYGDEIGMGDNFYLGDRNAVRTPMQWSPDRNAGFSSANPQKLYLPVVTDPQYHYEAVNVEAQQDNPDSLLQWTRTMAGLRRRFKAFGRGTFEPIGVSNPRILAFLRRYQDEVILVAANLSRQAQHAHLDLAAFAGRAVTGLAYRARFPPIEASPYLLTFGPYGFYWFALEPTTRDQLVLRTTVGAGAPVVAAADLLAGNPFARESRSALTEMLTGYIRDRRVSDRSEHIRRAQVLDVVPMPDDGGRVTCLIPVRLELIGFEPESYAFLLRMDEGNRALQILRDAPHAVVAQLGRSGDMAGAPRVLYDALADPAAGRAVLRIVAGRRRLRGEAGEVWGIRDRRAGALGLATAEHSDVAVANDLRQRPALVRYGDRLVLEWFRDFRPGINPELEMGRFLTERAGFRHSPRMAGALEYRRGREEEPVTLGVIREHVPSSRDAWEIALDLLAESREALARAMAASGLKLPSGSLVALSRTEVPEPVRRAMAGSLQVARSLGRRTAELHVALASDHDDPAFAPEPFSAMSRRSLRESARQRLLAVLRALGERGAALPAAAAAAADRAFAEPAKALTLLETVSAWRAPGLRIRGHGDYRLEHLRRTDAGDLVILGFEGDTRRSMTERRLKHSPLRDVAAMVLSLQYAAAVAASRHAVAQEAGAAGTGTWSRVWHAWASAAFLGAYVEAAVPGGVLPAPREVESVFAVYLLERALDEVLHDLSIRPDRLHVPLRAISQLLVPRDDAS